MDSTALLKDSLTELEVVVEAPGIDVASILGFSIRAVLSCPDVAEFHMA